MSRCAGGWIGGTGRTVGGSARLAVAARSPARGGARPTPAHAGVTSRRHLVVRATAQTGPRIGAPRVEELHAVGLDTDLRPLLAGGLVLPAILAERAFHVDRAPFPQELAAILGLAIPDRHIDEERLLAALAVATRAR